MNCDQVFDILTRGPFPAGTGDDPAVETHLEGCPSCRRLATALQPALVLLHEALSDDEAAGLPGYWGRLLEADGGAEAEASPAGPSDANDGPETSSVASKRRAATFPAPWLRWATGTTAATLAAACVLLWPTAEPSRSGEPEQRNPQAHNPLRQPAPIAAGFAALPVRVFPAWLPTAAALPACSAFGPVPELESREPSPPPAAWAVLRDLPATGSQPAHYAAAPRRRAEAVAVYCCVHCHREEAPSPQPAAVEAVRGPAPTTETVTAQHLGAPRPNDVAETALWSRTCGLCHADRP